MNKRSWIMIGLTVILALTLAACGGNKETPTAEPVEKAGQPEQAAKPTTAPSPTEAPQPTEPPQPTATPVPDETDLDLSSRDSGLDQLQSYRVTWRAEWKSTEPGKTDAGFWDWLEEFTSEPVKARHVAMKAPDSNDATKISVFEWWQIGDTLYMRSGDSQECIAITSEENASNLEQGVFNAGMLGDIQGAKYVGRETVNGVATKHYRYTKVSALIVGGGVSQGETWIAVDGGYAVKDVVSWTGGSGFLGLGGDAKGDGSWTWELSNINQPLEITAPEECSTDEIDLPLMPVTKEKTRFGNMISYKTVGTVAEAVQFYKDELEAAGWTPDGEPTQADDLVMLNYAKDKQKLSVMINGTEGDVTVILNLTE